MKLAMIILAAGLSRRMGVLKPLLPVGGTSAVMRCVNLASAVNTSGIFIVTGNGRERIEAAVRPYAPDVCFIHNEGYADGMFSSITAGARGLPAGFDGFFLLPADTCAVSPGTLRTLIEVYKETGGSKVVRPKPSDKRGHPPLIPASLTGALLSYGGEDGMRGFLRTCPYIEVKINDPGVLLDMDTPEDYVRLLEHLKLPVYPDISSCTELLAKYNTPERVAEHGKQVAALALKIAGLIRSRGAEIDTGLLESACLLHDIRRHEENHAQAGARLLLREGYPGAAILTAGHMDPPDTPSGRIYEAELLYLSDKLCRRGKIIPVEDTMRELSERFKDNAAALSSANRRMLYASEILNLLRKQYGIGYAEIIYPET